MPRFTLVGIIFILVVYIVGAKYPQLAQKIGVV